LYNVIIISIFLFHFEFKKKTFILSFNIKATNVLWKNASGDSSHHCCPHEEMLAVDRKKIELISLGFKVKRVKSPK
jgi:hypothetical protein